MKGKIVMNSRIYISDTDTPSNCQRIFILTEQQKTITFPHISGR